MVVLLGIEGGEEKEGDLFLPSLYAGREGIKRREPPPPLLLSFLPLKRREEGELRLRSVVLGSPFELQVKER